MRRHKLQLLTCFKMLFCRAFEVIRFDDEHDEELRIESLADGDGALAVDRLVLARELDVTCQVKDGTLRTADTTNVK